jgi:uroporphyrinogen-III synthase
VSGGLAGKRVVNTRALSQAAELDALLRKHGATPVSYPCIAISPPADTTALDGCLKELARGEFDWLVLTSANTVRSIARRMDRLDLRFPSPTRFRTAVVGPATRDAALRELELTATVMPETYQGSELAAAIPLIPDLRVLLPQSEIAPLDLANALTARGVIVTTVTAYRTVIGQGGAQLTPLVARGEVDAITFASSSAVDGFVTRLADEGSGPDLLAGIPTVCIGSSTANTAVANGFAAPIVPVEQTLTGLVDTLDLALSAGHTSKGTIS